MNKTLRLLTGLLVGCVVAIAIGSAGFAALQALWPEYAAAASAKDFSLAMLVARLSLGAVATAGAACVTTLLVREDETVAWWMGGLFVLLSLPSHLYFSWPDYPLWYHVVYLGYLVPIAGLTGRITRDRLQQLRPAA